LSFYPSRGQKGTGSRIRIRNTDDENVTDLPLLDPRVVVSDDVLVLDEGGVSEHLIHRHLLVMTVYPKQQTKKLQLMGHLQV
jgi:hypothetical protein